MSELEFEQIRIDALEALRVQTRRDITTFVDQLVAQGDMPINDKLAKAVTRLRESDVVKVGGVLKP